MKPTHYLFLIAMLGGPAALAQGTLPTIEERLEQKLLDLGVAPEEMPQLIETVLAGTLNKGPIKPLPQEPECKVKHFNYKAWVSRDFAQQVYLGQEITKILTLIIISIELGYPYEQLYPELEAAEQNLAAYRERAKVESAALKAEVSESCFDWATGEALDIAFYPGGRFTKTDDDQWRETNGNGSNYFRQTGFDDWSVYLKDINRHETYIQIDLWRRVIRYRTGNQGWSDIYPIEQVSSIYDFVE